MKKKLKQALAIKTWPVFPTIIGFYRICLLNALFWSSYLVICWQIPEIDNSEIVKIS